jgi:hypothetical protein
MTLLRCCCSPYPSLGPGTDAKRVSDRHRRTTQDHRFGDNNRARGQRRTKFSAPRPLTRCPARFCQGLGNPSLTRTGPLPRRIGGHSSATGAGPNRGSARTRTRTRKRRPRPRSGRLPERTGSLLRTGDPHRRRRRSLGGSAETRSGSKRVAAPTAPTLRKVRRARGVSEVGVGFGPSPRSWPEPSLSATVDLLGFGARGRARS